MRRSGLPLLSAAWILASGDATYEIKGAACDFDVAVGYVFRFAADIGLASSVACIEARDLPVG